MEERKVRREGAGEEGREELDKEQYSCAVSFWTAFLVALSWRTGGPTRMSADREEGRRRRAGGGVQTKPASAPSAHHRPDQMASGIECGGSASRRTG